jgi:hypothetical protein
VFYWRHLLNLASDSSRKDFEDQYAFCENLVLTSFSGAVVAVLHVAVLIGFALGRYVEPVVLLPFGPTPSVWLVLLGCVVGYLFYRAALPAHRDASASFRAIVDAVVDKFVQWTRSAEVPLPKADRERIDKLTEYLKALE